MRGLILSCALVLGFLPACRAADGTDRPYLLARKTLLQVQVQWLDEPQLSPDGRLLLFRRQDENNGSDAGPWNLWIANADGRGARLLARNAHHARWSPHSKRIAFLRGGEENDDPDGKQPPPPTLWTIRPDGSDARKVASNVAGWNTAWYNGMPATTCTGRRAAAGSPSCCGATAAGASSGRATAPAGSAPRSATWPTTPAAPAGRPTACR